MNPGQLQDSSQFASASTTAILSDHDCVNQYLNKGELAKSSSGLPSPPGSDGPISTLEDFLISGLESICGLFDNVYLLKTLGIISEENFLYKRLNKGAWGSKLWLVTLLLSARKLISRLLQIIRAKSELKKEMQQLKIEIEGDNDLVKQILKNKFTDALKKCSLLIKDVILELLQTLAYLAIVVIEILKININQRAVKILEPLSHFIAVMRIFTAGYDTLTF